MSNTTLEILRGTRTIKCGGTTLDIRELSWLDLKEFLAKLAEQTARFTDDKGNLAFTLDKIVSAIKDSQDLSEYLLQRTMSLDQDMLAALSVGEFLALVDASLDLNLSVITTQLKKIGGRLKGLVGAQAALPMTPRPTPTPPSSTS